MNILIACEESQAVCKAFLEKGHNVFSCDLEPCSGGRPDRHIQGDVIPLLDGECTFKTVDGATHTIQGKWDMLIAFPPCTHLAVSGARHFEQKRKDGRQQQGIDFFMEFTNADCDKISIENPIGIMSTYYKKPTQIIQPWQFGHEVQKSTCLWLKGLPQLVPTKIVSKGEFYISPSGKKMHIFHNKNINKKQDRQKSRSVTFDGIANAMAEQWG